MNRAFFVPPTKQVFNSLERRKRKFWRACSLAVFSELRWEFDYHLLTVIALERKFFKFVLFLTFKLVRLLTGVETLEKITLGQ
jgi:hypothetical protein